MAVPAVHLFLCAFPDPSSPTRRSFSLPLSPPSSLSSSPPSLSSPPPSFRSTHLVFALGSSSPKDKTPVFPSLGFLDLGLSKKGKSASSNDDDEEDEDEEEEEKKKGMGVLAGFMGRNGSADGPSLALRGKELVGGLRFATRRRQDPNSVFVAGATGQIGARIASKLLRQGFSVRGGVPDLFVAQQLAEFATQYGIISQEEAKRLNAVEFDFKDVESIAKAIGNAGKVVVTVGPSENGSRSRVTVGDASNVIEAAKLANIGHLVLVYEPGSGASGASGPFAAFTTLLGDLFKRGGGARLMLSDLIDRIVNSDMNYTILRTPPTDGVDDFSPLTQNLILLQEGTLTEGAKVSKAQVASLVAGALSFTNISENKIMEVSSSSSAPQAQIELLFSSIPTDGRRAAMAATQAKAEEEERERIAREKAEEDARRVSEEARKAVELATKLEAEAKKLAMEEARAATLAEQAQARAQAAAVSVQTLSGKVKELGITINTNTTSTSTSAKASGGPFGISFGAFTPPKISFKAEGKSAEEKPKPSAAPPKKKAGASTPKLAPQALAMPGVSGNTNSFLGGLFKQETIYVDED